MSISQIYLNNLVEFYLPITSNLISINCYIPPKQMKDKEVQKFDFQLDEQFCKEDFAKVFLFSQILKKPMPNSLYSESLLLSSIKGQIPKPSAQSNPKETLSQVDLELEALRNEVLNCGTSSIADDTTDVNKHSIKVQCVGNQFIIILKVSETFGVDLTSAKEHRNKELQEDLRSLSRMQESESEANCAEEGHIQDLQNLNGIQPQIGQLEIKNSQAQPLQQELDKKQEQDIRSNMGLQQQSRNNKQKQQQSFLEKAVNEMPTKVTMYEEDQQKSTQCQEKTPQQTMNSNTEKIFKRAFQQIVQGLRFYAWPCFRVPQSNNLIPLMNTSFLFSQYNHQEEKRDVDFLIALSLMSGRKFIQASEHFRKLQNELLTQNPNPSQQVIDKAIQFEILIADSMNQHSQLCEKIHAFQRAVDLFLKKKVKPLPLNNGSFSLHQIREEEAHKMLIMLHPYLIRILLLNIETKIEPLKVAVLRNIEFLIDQLGCSLDQNLTSILIAVINTYPRSYLHFNQNIIKSQNLPLRYGFYQQQQSQSSSFNYNMHSGHLDVKFDYALENSYMDSILFDQNDLMNIQIKEAQNFQNTYQASIKNLQNHILESFISLLSSMSSSTLHQIFYDVIQKSVFIGNNPFENQLATDLRIYLLKFADKIISICQGDLILSHGFLNNIVSTMIPDSKKQNQQFLGSNALQNQDIIKSKQKASETISLACHNLWQTFRTKLFINYSNKGLKQLLEWIFNNLVNFTEHSDCLSTDEQSKLTLVFDVIDLIATQHSNFNNEQSSKGKGENSNGDIFEDKLGQTDNGQADHIHLVHSLSGRETRLERMGDNQHIYNPDSNGGAQKSQSLIQIKTKSLSSLELYALINPILFWLDYSIEKLDRLPMFKIIWKTLNKLLNQLPSKKIDIDSISIILPVLQKVNVFCQTSTPPLEMLQFLQVVLTDFIKENKTSKDLKKFLDKFLITISKCIPHHLNEEIFVICEQLIELQKKQLRPEHIQSVIKALTDKYTMRSKAHKRLTSYFLNTVLDQSLQTLNNNNIAQHRDLFNQDTIRINTHNYQQQLHIQQLNQMHQNSQGAHQSNFGNPHEMHDDIDNYEYERDSNEQYIEDEGEDEESHQIFAQHQQQQQIQQQHQREQRMVDTHSTNQDYNESPISQRVIHNQPPLHPFEGSHQWNNFNYNPNHMIRPSNRAVEQDNIQTYVDILIDGCFFNNHYTHNEQDKQRDQILLELYFEKLNLFLQLIKSFNSQHILLFQRLLIKDGLREGILRIFNNERSQLNAIDILDSLSRYYIINCAPKNLYEHPAAILRNINYNYGGAIDQLGIQNQNNNNQSSQNSSHQQHFIQYNRESSRTSFVSNGQNNNQFQSQLRNNLAGSSNPQIQHQQQHINFQQQNPPQMMPSRQRSQQQQYLVEDDLMIDNLNENTINDELDIINKERLLLIQIQATIIKIAIDIYSQSQDAFIQFHTLNQIDNLFTNLMPVSTFQNQLIKQQINRQRMQHNDGQQQNKIRNNEIPDFEKITIVDNLQQYLSLISQQNNLSQNSQCSYVYQEFECNELKYLHGRLQFGLKIWNFLEQSLTSSSWSNIRSICYGIICQIIKIDISEYKSSYQNKVKQVLFPMLNNLLFSKESESKAGGLNILGSFCGLGHDFSQLSHFKLSENLQIFRKNSNFISLALWQQVFNLQDDWDTTIREAAAVLIQVCAPRDSIKHFNSIVQEKYYLKLSSMIKTFNAAANQNIRQNQYLGQQTPTNMMRRDSSALHEESKNDDQNTSFDQRLSLYNNYIQSTQQIRAMSSQQNLVFGNNEDDKNSNESSGKNSDQNEEENDSNYFYVDRYNEDQIKEIIGIFKNDYKPPKNLWIEKSGITANNYSSNQVDQQNGSNGISGTAHIEIDMSDQNNIIDVFEDKIVDRLNKIHGNTQVMEQVSAISQVLDQYFKKNESEVKNNQTNSQGESDYLIFERHFESEKDKKSSLLTNTDSQKANDSQIALDSINQEDLGIIDLDEDDGADEFDELDDDKLPVLKNTYSKKNRPNNSKSMAIGSRTQGMLTKGRSSSQMSEEERIIKVEHVNNKIQNSQKLKDEEVKIDGKLNDNEFEQSPQVKKIKNEENIKKFEEEKELIIIDSNENQADNLIEEYEKIIAQSIASLNQQLTETSAEKPKIKSNFEIYHDNISKSNLQQQFDLTQSSQIKSIRKLEDSKLIKEKTKTNKSFDLNKRKTGSHRGALSSPFKAKDLGLMQNLTMNDLTQELDNHKDLKLSSVNQGALTKKINDPLQQNSKKSYSQQAARLKVQPQNMKRDSQSNSKAQLGLANTSPGPILSVVLNPQSTKQQNSVSKNQFNSQSSYQRKRKSEYQRKSDGPPYTSKKFTQSSLAQASLNLGIGIGTEKQIHNNTHSSLLQASQSSFLTNSAQISNSNVNASLNIKKSGQQATLMQQAKQAFVSRAKSQSYLNSVMAIGGSTSSVNSSSKTKGSFKQKNVQSMISGYLHKGKRQPGDMGTGENSSTSGVNSACSGGNGGISNNLATIHKGYFSNDECEKLGQPKIPTQKIISPPKSGDLLTGKGASEQSLSSEDEEGKNNISKTKRAQSHHLKRKGKRSPNGIPASDEDEDLIQRKQLGLLHTTKFDSFNPSTAKNINNNEYSLSDSKYNKQNRQKKTRPFVKQEFQTQQKNMIFNVSQEDEDDDQVIGNEDYLQEIEDDNEADFEEFTSGEESTRGNLKPLSCIDEEDDASDRKDPKNKTQ